MAEVEHSRPALGIRITAPDGRAIAYSGDTGPCSAVVELARGVQWLLHECTVAAPFAGHSTPEDVGRVAQEADVGCVGIVHTDPLYVLDWAELESRVHAAGFLGSVSLMEDMDEWGIWMPFPCRQTEE